MVSVFWFLMCSWTRLSASTGQIWLRRAPVPGKGPLRKHFKSFIQCWLALLLAWRLSTFHQTCRIVEHILSERAGEPRREQVAGTLAIKQMLLVGLGWGWEAEYSKFISASKVGHKTVVEKESCSHLAKLGILRIPRRRNTSARFLNSELGSGRSDVDEMQHLGHSLESCQKDTSGELGASHSNVSWPPSFYFALIILKVRRLISNNNKKEINKEKERKKEKKRKEKKKPELVETVFLSYIKGVSLRELQPCCWDCNWG